MATTELLTVPEVAAILRLQASTIRSWLLKRKLPHVKLGRRVFLRRCDIDSFVDAGVVPAKLTAPRDSILNNSGRGPLDA